MGSSPLADPEFSGDRMDGCKIFREKKQTNNKKPGTVSSLFQHLLRQKIGNLSISYLYIIMISLI